MKLHQDHGLVRLSSRLFLVQRERLLYFFASISDFTKLTPFTTTSVLVVSSSSAHSWSKAASSSVNLRPKLTFRGFSFGGLPVRGDKLSPHFLLLQ